MGTRKQKENVIKGSPDERDVVINNALISSIVSHVQVYGFSEVITNVIEAYRMEARKYNNEAEKLDKCLKKKENEN